LVRVEEKYGTHQYQCPTLDLNEERTLLYIHKKLDEYPHRIKEVRGTNHLFSGEVTLFMRGIGVRDLVPFFGYNAI